MKVKLFFAVLCILFQASCSSSRKISTNKNNNVKALENPINKLPSVRQQQHVKKLEKGNKPLNKYTLQYIKKYAPLAVLEMHKYDIPASITLAQGILESGNGRSRLASKSNNHFGIKCHVGWKGAKVYHDDDEKGECFRVYSDPAKSYRDHSLFLSERSRYAFLFKIKKGDYKSWAKGLKKAGYATDPKYPDKLISLIERFDLDKFDHKKKNKKKSETPSLVEKAEKKSVKTHQVIKGDTLYSISKKYNIDLETLAQKNQIIDNAIFLGQDLIIPTNE